MDEPTLFDAAQLARDTALEQVDDHADDQWKAEAWNFLVDYLENHQTMFVDDLWDAGLPPTREDRAVGPLFLKAARMGLMVKTPEYRPSVRSHLTGKPVWRSLIFSRRGQLTLETPPVSDPWIINTKPL